MGHLVRDLEVLLCPFRLGNKFCPVEWTKSNCHSSSSSRFLSALQQNRAQSRLLYLFYDKESNFLQKFDPIFIARARSSELRCPQHSALDSDKARLFGPIRLLIGMFEII